jgi:hypothetical protein
MFDLTKQVLGNFAKSAGQGLYNASQNAIDYFKENFRDVQSGQKKPQEIATKFRQDFNDTTTNLAVTFLRETGAGATSLLKGTAEGLATNATPEQKQKIRTATGPVEQKLFGRTTKTPQQVYENIGDFVKEKEGSQVERAFLPLAGTLGYVFMENPLNLPAKSVKIPLESMEFIAKSTNQNVIRELIKENVPGISTRTLNRVSRDLVEVNSLDKVIDYFGGNAKIGVDLDTPDFSNSSSKLETEAVKQRLLQTSDNISNPQKNLLDTLVDDTSKDPNLSSLDEPFKDGSIADVGKFESAKSSLNNFITSTRETFQDSWIKIKQLQNKQGLDDLTEGTPYARYVLGSGRVEGRNRELSGFMESLATDYQRIADEYAVPVNTLRDDVNAYLWYKHAPERNAKLGDGAAGVLSDDAIKNLDELKSKPYFKEIEAKAKLVQDLGKEKLDVLESSGIISKESRAELESLYPNYVSFERVFDDADFTGSFTRGYDVKSSTLRRAKGSQLQIDDIVSNQIFNLSRAYVAAEKNTVMKALVDFEKTQKLGMLEVVSAKPMFNKDLTPVLKDGKPVLNEPKVKQFKNDEGLVPFFDEGKKKYLKFKDEGIADIVSGISFQKLPGFLDFIPKITRLYSQLQTRFSPSFMAPNKIRDLQEALVYFASTNGGKYRLASAIKKDKESIQTIFSYLRNKDLNAPLQKEYDEFLKSGATTGGLSAMTKGDIKFEWEDALKTQSSKPRQFAQKVIKSIDFWGEVTENSTRFTVYRLAKEAGKSAEEAAFIAKEASVNFNKTGTAGPIVNSLYMFANAAIQGNTKMLKALKNPKTAAKLLTVIGGSVVAVNQYNNSIDPDWKKKVNKWDRVRGLNIVVPKKDGSFGYFSIPVGYGLIPIKATFDSVDDVITGDMNIGDAVKNVTTSMIQSYNPVGGTDLLQALTPTIAEVIPVIDIARNKAWHGGMIRPEYDPYAPNSTKYFKDLKDTATGRGAILATAALSKLGIELSPEDLVYAYESVIGSAGKDVSNLFDTLVGATRGEVDINKTPIIRRFYREKSEEKVQTASSFYDKLDTALTEQSRDKFYIKQQAEGVADHLSVLETTEERAAYLKEIATQKPEVFEKFKDIVTDKNAGLTYSQRKVKELNIKNGARAKFIYDEVLKGESTETQKQILKEYVAKGLVDKEVLTQLLKLKNS